VAEAQEKEIEEELTKSQYRKYKVDKIKEKLDHRALI